jgi:hypothetical protein
LKISYKECFVKQHWSTFPDISKEGKKEKGCYWTVHPDWIVDGAFKKTNRRNRTSSAKKNTAPTDVPPTPSMPAANNSESFSSPLPFNQNLGFISDGHTFLPLSCLLSSPFDGFRRVPVESIQHAPPSTAAFVKPSPVLINQSSGTLAIPQYLQTNGSPVYILKPAAWVANNSGVPMNVGSNLVSHIVLPSPGVSRPQSPTEYRNSSQNFQLPPLRNLQGDSIYNNNQEERPQEKTPPLPSINQLLF